MIFVSQDCGCFLSILWSTRTCRFFIQPNDRVTRQMFCQTIQTEALTNGFQQHWKYHQSNFPGIKIFDLFILAWEWIVKFEWRIGSLNRGNSYLYTYLFQCFLLKATMVRQKEFDELLPVHTNKVGSYILMYLLPTFESDPKLIRCTKYLSLQDRPFLLRTQTLWNIKKIMTIGQRPIFFQTWLN